MNSYQQWQILVKFKIPLFYRYFYNHLSNYTKAIIRLRLVNIGEYSPRLRLGEYKYIYGGPQVQRRNKKSRQNKFQLTAQQNKFAVKRKVTAK